MWLSIDRDFWRCDDKVARVFSRDSTRISEAATASFEKAVADAIALRYHSIECQSNAVAPRVRVILTLPSYQSSISATKRGDEKTVIFKCSKRMAKRGLVSGANLRLRGSR